MAFYDAIPASDGTTLTAPMNAEFKVFEVTDTARANPLPLRSVAGLDAAPLVTTAQGVVPPVEVVSPNFEHIFQSGEWEWRRESSEGMRKDVKEARAAAVEVQQRIESGELIGEPGPEGRPGIPGVNAIPASDAVASYASTPGNPVNELLAGTYVGKDSQVIDVRDYGAKGDGKTDDTAAISAAITAAKGRRVILTSASEYVINSLRLPTDTHLDLNGGTLIQVKPTGSSATGAAVRNSDVDGNSNKNITIRNGTIRLGASAKGRPLALVGVTNVLVDGITIDKGTGTFTDWMLYLRRCTDVRISNFRLIGGRELGEDGLHLKECQRVVVNNGVIDSGDDCVVVVQEFGCTRVSSDITISNIVASSHRAHLVRVSVFKGETFGVERVTISNVVGSAPSTGGGSPALVEDQTNTGLVRDIVFDNMEFDCSAAIGIGLEITNISNATFRSVRLRNPFANGVKVTNSSKITLDDCHVISRVEGGQASTDAFHISFSTEVTALNCSVVGSTQHSFVVTGAGSADVTFVGCRSTNPKGYNYRLAYAANVALVGCGGMGGTIGVINDPANPASGVRVIGCNFTGLSGNVLSGNTSDLTYIGNSDGTLAQGGNRFSGKIGFYGATPINKATVAGSTGGNAALSSLIAALTSYGLISNGTSA